MIRAVPAPAQAAPDARALWTRLRDALRRAEAADPGWARTWLQGAVLSVEMMARAKEGKR